MQRTMLLAAVLVLFACSGEDKKALCDAIAKTPEAALQPRDRVFFETEPACADARLKKAQDSVAAAEALTTEMLIELGNRPGVGTASSCGGLVWAGSCKSNSECRSCKCVKGECVVP